MRSFSIIAIAVLTLGGCASPQERDYRADAHPTAYQEQMQNTADANRCASFGAQPGTDAYTNCRLQLAQIHAQETALAITQEADAVQQDEARKLEALRLYMQFQQNNYNQQMENQRAGMQAYGPQPPTNCMSSVAGNSVSTSCY